jgi:hypothetical protein
LVGTDTIGSVAGEWNKVPLPATAINAGSTYWIAILSPSDGLQFRDQVWGGGPVKRALRARSLRCRVPGRPGLSIPWGCCRRMGPGPDNVS